MEDSEAQENVATTAREAESPGGILPWAVPTDDNYRLASSEEILGRAFEFASALEAFASADISVAADQGIGLNRVRTFFVSASIPGIPDKIPVFGLKETRSWKAIRKITEFTIEIFVFNGQERVKTGVAFYSVKSDKSFGEFRLLSAKELYTMASGNVSSDTPTIYDNGGTGKFVLASKGKKGKAFAFEAKDITNGGRTIANVNLHYESSFRTKKFRNIEISFNSAVDPVLKPQLVLSSLMIMYLKKMF
mmetsp:Transcript_42/g.66  ORF Transcript_42/g.66 Transcript_42/m.66 type:complete len:249 (+) Transcript_42:260-1006(+)